MRKRRRRSRVFRRRRIGPLIGKIFLWLLVIPALIGGYYLAEYLFNRPAEEPTVAPPAVTAPTEPKPTEPPKSDPDTEPDTKPEPDTTALKGIKAIYLPVKALRDLSRWDATLSAAQKAGYNAVLFDLKDATGKVWYTSATEWAKEARSVDEDALTVEQLQAAVATLKETYQLTAIPRLFAFRDHTAPRYLETARVSVKGSPSSVWYDNDPSAGGRRWLNPYAPDATAYITALATELRNFGFPLLMLDGVQFPGQESQAYYGNEEQTALSRDEVLKGFVQKMNEAVGETGWLLSATALASVGEKTNVYGGNPVTYGAPAVSPWVIPGDMGSRLTVGGDKVSKPGDHPYEAASLLFSQLKARLGLMEQPPVIVPWLQAEGYSKAEVAKEVQALTEQFGESAPYILYHPDGTYKF